MKNIYDIYDIFESLTTIEDPRQFNTLKYPINEIICRNGAYCIIRKCN